MKKIISLLFVVCFLLCSGCAEKSASIWDEGADSVIDTARDTESDTEAETVANTETDTASDTESDTEASLKITGKEKYLGIAYNFNNTEAVPQPLFLVDQEEVNQFFKEHEKCQNIGVDFGDWGMRWPITKQRVPEECFFIGTFCVNGKFNITCIPVEEPVAEEDFRTAEDGTVRIGKYFFATNEYGYAYLVEIK